MSKEGYDFWKYINTYEELLKVGNTYIGVLFDLYVSKEGQLGLAKYDPESYHKPPRPLKGVKANSATRLDISQMLSWVAKTELKRPVPKSLNMLLDNEDIVIKIEGHIQAYSILSK